MNKNEKKERKEFTPISVPKNLKEQMIERMRSKGLLSYEELLIDLLELDEKIKNNNEI